MGKKPAAKSAETAKTTKTKETVKEVKLEAKAEKKEEKTKKHHVHLERATQHCKIKSCKHEYRAKGYCQKHYKKWRQGQYGLARYKTCHEMDCRKPMTLNRHGFCEAHYQNFYVKGMKPAVVEAPAKEEKVEEKATA
jgi:hypothetical protein